MRLRPAFVAIALAVLAACTPKAQEAQPALWQVKDGQGHLGWLFGTIHTSKTPLVWNTPPVRKALHRTGIIMVEVSNLADESAVAATFADLARSSGQPPLSQRIAPDKRAALAKLLKRGGYTDGDFAGLDTWAVALTLARIGGEEDDARNGVDRAVIADAGTRPVVELEGAKAQLALFDSLPEREQRDLLGAVVTEADQPDKDLSQSWRHGDMAAIEKETRSGLLADPELRAVLFTGRNTVWSQRIADALRSDKRPFVAVGAAHMAGPDGIPAMLAKQGFTVTRLE